MSSSFFRDLVDRTPTRVWVNNPTAAEVRLALTQGAVGCTTNPAFVGGLIKRAPGEALPVVAEIVAREPDDERAAELIQERIVRTILAEFLPVFARTDGLAGYVSLQGSPERDTEATAIEIQARAARALAPNCIPKIPATIPGLAVFDKLVAEGQPTLITEVFSLAQVIETCERYLAATAATGNRPVFVMAPITGILGDHLRSVAKRDGIGIDPAVVDLAGVAFARAAARVVREREYPVTLLFGGARTMLDLTGLVGEHHQATVNWSTFDEILKDDVEVANTIADDVPEAALRALTTSFETMDRAMREDGLALEEFEAFGPVQHFRDNFIAGWNVLEDAVRSARAGSGTVA